jgi:hypothetical protein
MAPIHPLKRKSVKPSISTVRGMLPGKQFRALDAAMQSLRTAGLRLDWQWKNKIVGWVCVGLLDDKIFCEIHPFEEPLMGMLILGNAELEHIKASPGFPKKYKKILDLPVDSENGKHIYEFSLEDSRHRDLFSNFVEGVVDSLEDFQVEEEA